MAKDGGGGFAKVLLLHVAALSTAGAVAAAAALAQHRLTGGDRRRKKQLHAPAMAEMPKLQVAESGRLDYLEKFSHYVARQLGFKDVIERVPTALQTGKQLPQQQQHVHGGHLRVFLQRQGRRVPLRQAHRGAGQMHPWIFCVPLGPCYLPHQLGLDRGQPHQKEVEEHGLGSNKVHQSSTDAASSLLVTALNEGRDVILDGTLSWELYVEQTIAMARAVHRQRYRMGVGYKVADDGTVTETYWEPDDQAPPSPATTTRKPYRIEIVGVVCDAYLAVARGIRRAIITRRAVRVRSQLQSHKRFAAAFPRYSRLVDGARLYSTNSIGSGARLIAWKDSVGSSLLVEPREFDCLDKVSRLNVDATSVHDLYPDGTTVCGERSIWEDMIAAPARADTQGQLKEAISSIEAGGGGEPDTPTTPQRELLGIIRSVEEAANGEVPAAVETPTAAA